MANNFETYLSRSSLFAEAEEYPIAGTESPFEILWHNSSDAMILTDTEGIVSNANETFCKMAGISRKELIGQPSTYINELLKINKEAEFNLYNYSGGEQINEIHAVIEDEPRILQVRHTSFYIPEPGVQNSTTPLVLSVFRDVTFTSGAGRTDEILKGLLNSSQDGIIECSLSGTIRSWNTGAERIFGYSKNDITGNVLSFLFPQVIKKELSGILIKCRTTNQKSILETYTNNINGNKIFVTITAVPINDKAGKVSEILLIVKDVSKEKKTEFILQESRERYRSLLETSPDAILLTDFSGKILLANRLFAKIMGLTSVDKLQGRSIFSSIPGNEYIRVLRYSRMLVETGRINHTEFTLIDNNNRHIPVEVSASITVDNMGMPGTAILVIRDISERKTAEQKLRNSELQFRSVWENSNDGMRLTDEDGNIIAVNRAFCRLVEMEEEELKGKPFNFIYNEKEPIYIDESLRLYRKNFKERKFDPYKQSRSTLSCGKTVELDVAYSRLDFEKGKSLLLAIFHDVTERKKVEEELRINEKHAAIGKMAAYLSHEIKTPLASIKLNIDMLSRSLELSNDKQRSFLIIQKEIKRLNNLLKNVLQFSRQADLVYMNININSLINNIKDLVEASLCEKQIKFINNTAPVTVKGDYQKLHTVLLHMIENSAEAIVNNGTIEVYTVAEAKTLKLYIKDSGSGISFPSQIFDPFFTTKSSGTGLGLSIAQKIIEQHNGTIELVSSAPGKTIFAITFSII
jgi:two-component system, sporulation sensor kinase E